MSCSTVQLKELENMVQNVQFLGHPAFIRATNLGTILPQSSKMTLSKQKSYFRTRK
jgi:hypothetical protein